MVILRISHFPLQWTVWQPFHLIPSFTFADMVDEELPYEHQLDEIAARVNKFRADGIQPGVIPDAHLSQVLSCCHGARSVDRH